MRANARGGEGLEGARVAVPEARELDRLAALLEARGASVLRVPLVAIRNAPDPAPVLAWLERAAADELDDLVLYTGEGLRRLRGFAARARGDLEARFVRALARVRTVTRGPKPAAALREIGLRPSLPAAAPTTEGILETLAPLELCGRRVGVQLAGGTPVPRLERLLEEKGAEALFVTPYVYADASEETAVASLVEALDSGTAHAIAFTSAPQVRRLFQVARRRDALPALRRGLERATVAAIGPVAARALEEEGVRVDVAPERTFAMTVLVDRLADHHTARRSSPTASLRRK